MPVMNAVSSTWDVSGISIPTTVNAITGSMQWDGPKEFITSSFRSQQISSIEYDANINKGSPNGTIWKVGDNVWQIDFSTPFLVPFSFNADIGEHSLYCANLPRIDGFSYPTSNFINAALLNYQGIPSGDATPNMRSIHHLNAEQDYWDIIIQKVRIEVNETQSVLHITLICTKDPRTWFTPIPAKSLLYANGTSQVWSDEPVLGWRTAKPWDFIIPVNDRAIFGSPGVGYSGGGWSSIPARSQPAGNTYHDFMIRSIDITIENKIQRFMSVGTTSARPFLAISSRSVNGAVSGVPVYWDNGVPSSGLKTNYPGGWMPDTQMLEEINRSGGQLYVTGQPDYSYQGPQSPLYIELGMRQGSSNYTGYYVIHRNALGPIGVATLSMQQQGGAENEMKMDFQTLVGITPIQFSTLTSRS